MNYLPYGTYPPQYPGYQVTPPDPYQESVRLMRKRSNAIGWTLCGFLVFSFVASFMVSMGVSFMGVPYQEQYADFGGLSPELYFWMIGLVYILSLFLPFLILGCASREPMSQLLTFEKLHPLDFLLSILFGFGVCLAANIPTNVIVTFIQSMGFSGQMPSYPETDHTGANLLYVTVIAILAPFFEEFVFRGVILGKLRRFGNGIAIFGSAIAFGMFHGNFIQIPFAFLCGLALGYIVVRTGSLWASVLVHFLNNSFSVFQEFWSKSADPETYYLISGNLMIAIMGIGLVCGICLLLTRKKHAAPQPPEAQIPVSRRVGAFFLSPGMILFLLLSIAQAVQVLIEMG